MRAMSSSKPRWRVGDCKSCKRFMVVVNPKTKKCKPCTEVAK